MANATRTVISPTFRMSFPNFVTPVAFQGKGDPSYGCEMIFKPEDLTKFRLWDEDAQSFQDVDIAKLVVEVIKEKWSGIDVKAEFGSKWPIIKGEDRAAKAKGNGDAYLGNKVIRCKASKDYAPRLLCTENGARVELNRFEEADKAKANDMFVGGFYAFAELTVKALETPQGKFVPFYANSIRFVRPGERFGGTSLMDRLDAVSGGSADHDPTGGAASDDIPL